MSSNLVLVTRIDTVKPHPNADRLELAVVGGWQCVVPKGRYSGGDLVTYIPPDSMIPLELSEQLGITKYLSNSRVRAAKLRGEPSFGVVMEPRGTEGENVADLLGITKYTPAIKFTAGEAEESHPAFQHYTDIENLRNYSNGLTVGERVIATEKIHGTNSRLGLIREGDGWKRVAGSRTLQRRFSEGSTYWYPWTLPGVELLANGLTEKAEQSVSVYGEVYGRVQALRYGLPNGLGFRLFDASVDGRYLDHDALVYACGVAGVEMVPIVYDGPFSLEAIAAASKGRSLIPNADHIREGVVVRPANERTDPRLGRVVFKYVSDEYLCGDWDGANE